MPEFPSLKDGREVRFNPDNDPYGWIQWKGTTVCIDIHCKCGAHLHYDGSFAYFLKCKVCETIYELNGHIELIEVKPESIEDGSTVQYAEGDDPRYVK